MTQFINEMQQLTKSVNKLTKKLILLEKQDVKFGKLFES
jgi:hypothetical protein